MWGKPTVNKQWVPYAVNTAILVSMVPLGYMSYPFIGFLYLLNPTPTEEYIWEKGNYRITAYGNRSALRGYGRTIYAWEWQEKSSTENIALSDQQKH